MQFLDKLLAERVIAILGQSFVFSLLLITSTSLFISGCSDSPGRAKMKAKQKLAEAVELISARRYEEALPLLDEAVRLNPENTDSLLARGTVYRKCQRYSEAITDYDSVIRIEPQNGDAYCQRAFARQQSLTDPTENTVLADANRAIELDPDSALAHLIRGNVHVLQRNFDKAISDFSRTAQLNPRSYSAFGCRARAYFMKHEFQKAEKDYETAFSLHPPAEERKVLEINREFMRQEIERMSRIQTK